MDDLYPLTICPERFRMTFQNTQVTIPCAWSHPIDKNNDNIERVVIVIHGVLRNADEYFPNMLAAATQAGVENYTLVIAPQFLVEDDICRFGLPDDVLFWGGETGEGWKKGDDSISTGEHPRTASASAFEVVDTINYPSSQFQYLSKLKKNHCLRAFCRRSIRQPVCFRYTNRGVNPW